MKHFLETAGMIVVLLSIGLHGGPLLAQTKLETRQVALSQNIKIGDRIGRIRFLGMLELPDITRNGLRLSQLSGLAWDDDDGILYAISDKGGLFHLRPEFDGNILTGLSLLRAEALHDPGNNKPHKRSYADSEGMDILYGRNGRKGDAELVISFERVPRIMRYRPDGHAIGEYPLPDLLANTKNYSSTNRMLESVCVDPSLGVITTPEVALTMEREGHTHLYSLPANPVINRNRRASDSHGASPYNSWDYPLAAGNRITAMECLGHGQVMVLQQKFLHAFGNIVVTLEQVRLPATPAAEPLLPKTIATFDSQGGHQIDNFEGLTRHRENRFFMVSDNNDLFVQRTLLMYFEVLEE